MAKVYTRGGDKGQTSLIGGTRVSKAHHRLETYGTIDELNSVVGLLRCEMRSELATHPAAGELQEMLSVIQHDLFNVGSQLACENPDLCQQMPSVDLARVTELEKTMDRFTAELKPLKNFILPGGSRSAAQAHIARTVCRRAERLCVAFSEEAAAEAADCTSVGGTPLTASVDPHVIQYVNRLSDFFFVFARYLNHLLKIEEPIWEAKKKG